MSSGGGEECPDMAAAMGGVAVMRMGFVPHYGAREGGSVQRFPFLELEPKATLGMAFWQGKKSSDRTHVGQNILTHDGIKAKCS